jgi:hypothetical protein
VAYDLHNDRILVTNRVDDTVTLLDAATGAPAFVTLPASTFPAGDSPGSVTWANGQFFFLAEGDGTIHAMNDDGEIDSVFVGADLRALAALPGSETIYVADDSADELVLVGGGDNRSASTFITGGEPRAVAAAPSLDLRRGRNCRHGRVRRLADRRLCERDTRRVVVRAQPRGGP